MSNKNCDFLLYGRGEDEIWNGQQVLIDKNIPEGKSQEGGMTSPRCRVGYVHVVIGFAWAKSLWPEL